MYNICLTLDRCLVCWSTCFRNTLIQPMYNIVAKPPGKWLSTLYATNQLHNYLLYEHTWPWPAQIDSQENRFLARYTTFWHCEQRLGSKNSTSWTPYSHPESEVNHVILLSNDSRQPKTTMTYDFHDSIEFRFNLPVFHQLQVTIELAFLDWLNGS